MDVTDSTGQHFPTPPASGQDRRVGSVESKRQILEGPIISVTTISSAFSSEFEVVESNAVPAHTTHRCREPEPWGFALGMGETKSRPARVSLTAGRRSE
jgi:hypothetical protein